MHAAAGAALIRVAAYPTDLVLPAWPDLASDRPGEWREWLRSVWALPEFAAAVTIASPDLATRISHAENDQLLPDQQLRRLVTSVVRYLLRWTTRSTPFGTFAGVAPVRFGTCAEVHVGDAHHVVARPDSQSLTEGIRRAEQNLAALRAATVVTNSLGYQRGRNWVLPCARADGDRLWDITIGLTGPLRVVFEAAQTPVGFVALAATIAEPGGIAAAERLLAELVQLGVLLSGIRPPMTVTDRTIFDRFAPSDPGDRSDVDLRADVTVTLPQPVLREAGRAASTLIAVAPRFHGWAEYRDAFSERWGPGAAVPIRDVLNVLGFPAGYRGSTRCVPAVFTARDRLLGQLAQQSALDGCAEIELDDDLIDRLRTGDDRPPTPHTELRFTLAADTPQELDRGAFTVTVLSGSRHAGVSSGRFLHLLTPAELAAFQRVLRELATAMPDADAVQLSGPPLDARLTAVARVPEVLPLLPLGEFHPDPPWTLNDLAVAGDGERLWLVSRTTGRPVEPLLFNSVVLPTLQPPLMRFLTEIWTVWNAPCSRFDWGYAADLPFLPRVRRGRSVLHPARWLIERTALPDRAQAWSRWRGAWQRHRDQRRLPQQILVGDDDVQLRLDLENDAHLAVLRDHLDRHPRTALSEAPGSAGWIRGRPAELVLTLTRPASVQPPARTARPARTVQHWPGSSHWLQAHLFGGLDDILTDLATRPADHLPVGWWFVRYPDPEPHLRLRVPLTDAGPLGEVAHRLAAWADELAETGALRDYSLHTYRPETRHGTGTTLAAAEVVFAADSRTCLHRLADDRQATTAASMIGIAETFADDGLRWLSEHVPRRSGPRLDPAQLERARVPFHDAQLDGALAAYRAAAGDDRLDVDQVLVDLLHLHHARMIGVDIASEQHCLRLARTFARSARLRRAP